MNGAPSLGIRSACHEFYTVKLHAPSRTHKSLPGSQASLDPAHSTPLPVLPGAI